MLGALYVKICTYDSESSQNSNVSCITFFQENNVGAFSNVQRIQADVADDNGKGILSFMVTLNVIWT